MYWPFVWPAVTFILVTLAAMIVREIALRALRRWMRPPEVAASVLHIVRVPSLFWCFVPGIAAAMEVAHLPARTVNILNLTLTAAIIFSVTVTIANVVAVAIVRAGDRRALGVGGLAVALALQDTLSNLFAGLHLLADKPIRVGDYVKIADNVEGFVVDVGWRSTRVRLLMNSVVIVPNSTVAKSTIINYDLPESRMALLIHVSADYASDPDRVAAVLVEEAERAVAEVPGLLADPKPQARLIPGFGDSGLEFTLVCHVARFVDQYPVQDELRKRILRRFRTEGIVIPFPTRVIHQVRADGAG